MAPPEAGEAAQSAGGAHAGLDATLKEVRQRLCGRGEEEVWSGERGRALGHSAS